MFVTKKSFIIAWCQRFRNNNLVFPYRLQMANGHMHNRLKLLYESTTYSNLHCNVCDAITVSLGYSFIFTYAKHTDSTSMQYPKIKKHVVQTSQLFTNAIRSFSRRDSKSIDVF